MHTIIALTTSGRLAIIIVGGILSCRDATIMVILESQGSPSVEVTLII